MKKPVTEILNKIDNRIEHLNKLKHIRDERKKENEIKIR